MSRRDFTINAMAYHPVRGLADYFGGAEDLAAGMVRCVGDPAKRFGEDALRILRALRFAATRRPCTRKDSACVKYRPSASKWSCAGFCAGPAFSTSLFRLQTCSVYRFPKSRR